MNFLEAVIHHIQTAGIAAFGQNMFANEYPSKAPDSCLLVIDTGGLEPSLYLPVSNPTIQVLSRAPKYPEAEAKIRQVFNLFHGPTARHNYWLGDYYVFRSHAVQEPGFIGPDEKGRDEVSVNFVFKIRRPV
ncbi:MAG: minor capsid protein [Bacillota bacterium]